MMDEILGKDTFCLKFWYFFLYMLAHFGACLKSDGGVEDVVVVDVCQCSAVRRDHRSDHFSF